MAAQPEVGQRIKQVRLEKGLTLKDVEARAGVSATHVSEIERGRTSPTVGALTRIAAALDTEPAHLVEDHRSESVSVVRRDERRRLLFESPGVWLESLSRDLPGCELSIFLLEWDRDVTGESLTLRQSGEEFALVIEGEMELQIEGRRHVLKEGDSIHYDAALPHQVRKVGSARSRSLWAVYPRLGL